MKAKVAGAALGMVVAATFASAAWGQGAPPLASLNGDALRAALAQR